MYGFKPKSARGKAVPQLADGENVKPRGFKEGGLILGPGTGTSDSIETEKRPGTFIMPADSTQAIGPEALERFGAPEEMDDDAEEGEESVPVRLSNGEFELPPEQVQALGEAVLTVMRNATHEQSEGGKKAMPKAAGFAPRQFFADGGTVKDDERAKLIQQIPADSNMPVDAPAAAPAPSTPGGAVFGFYPQLAGGQRTTYATDAKLRTGVQATGPSTFAPATPSERTIIGGSNGQRMNAAQDPRSLTNGATAGNDAAAPSSATTAPPQPDGRSPVGMSVADAQKQGLVGERVGYDPAYDQRLTGAPGQNGAVTRNGNSYAGTNVSGDITVNGQAPGGGAVSSQNMVAADALQARQTPAGFQPAGSQQAGVQAPIVRNSTNDWAARKALENAATAASSITANGGRFDQNGRAGSPQAAAYRAALANDFALQQAQPEMDQAAMRENAGIQREGMQQEGATNRTSMQEQGSNTRDAGRNALTAEELGLKREAQGFQTRAAAQREKLRNTLIDPKATPEQRKQAQEYLQALAVSDKEPSPQYKSYVMPAIRNADGSTTEGGVYQENTRTGEGRWVKPQGQGELPAGMKRQIGTSNGRPVYEDMNGKKVIAKG